jgi:nucleoside 2-deoxyribosyltransferase
MSAPRDVRLYVACCLTGAPEELLSFVPKVKEALRDEGFTVLEFFGTDTWDPETTASVDIMHVWACDGVVAICDERSTGLGIEIGEAAAMGKSILGFAREGARISQLVVGYGAVRPNFMFFRYRTIEDIVREACRHFDGFLARTTHG